MDIRFVIVRGQLRLVRPGRSASSVQAQAQLPGSTAGRDQPPAGRGCADPTIPRG